MVTIVIIFFCVSQLLRVLYITDGCCLPKTSGCRRWNCRMIMRKVLRLRVRRLVQVLLELRWVLFIYVHVDFSEEMGNVNKRRGLGEKELGEKNIPKDLNFITIIFNTIHYNNNYHNSFHSIFFITILNTIRPSTKNLLR